MTLIARSRIIEYIDEHPEARITLLTWLKEYPYIQELRMFSDQNGNPIQGSGAGIARPDLGFYNISYRINCDAKAVFINWIGTKQEHEEENERKLKESQQKIPNVERIVKVTDIIIKSPGSKSTRHSAENRQKQADIYKASSLPANTETLKQLIQI